MNNYELKNQMEILELKMENSLVYSPIGMESK